MGGRDLPKGRSKLEASASDVSIHLVVADIRVDVYAEVEQVVQQVKLVPEILDEGEDAVRQKLEMLVRAYDPCISCSTHMLDVEFVK